MENYYLGVDVSKGYADFVILDSDRKIVEDNFQLDDTFAGHCTLYELLEEFLKNRPGAKLFAGVESTGGYENNWYNTLRKFQQKIAISVVRLNPKGVYHSTKASLSRNVTDKISAYSIAEYLISRGNKISYDCEDYYADLRKQKKFIGMLTKQKVQIENQLDSILYSANPELLVYCKKKKPAWLLQLLLSYPTANKLSRARVYSLEKIPYIKAELVEEIITNAKRSVASSSGLVTEHLIVSTVKQILHLEKIIGEHKELMAKNCELEEVDLLKSFIGISDYSAISLILEIGIVERFPKVKKLASYFGVHPVYKQSGDGKYGMHMSKQGRKEARAILYMIAFSAIVHNPVISKLYANCISKGMKSGSAMGVCMHKILRIVYGMLKNKRKFDPVIDFGNQQKNEKKENKTPVDKKRRYLILDDHAPISRRQYKKRKVQIQSQDVNNIKRGIMN